MKELPPICFLCGQAQFRQALDYQAPPEREVRFDFSSFGRYQRQVWECCGCGVFVSVHPFSMKNLYQSQYVDSTYGADGIGRAFARIIALPPEQSDNVGRVERINRFAGSHLPGARRVLDVGSGLGVFPYQMQHTGWSCTALDPDPRAAKHAADTVKVRAVCADFITAAAIGSFELVAFNKVLEHVEDPVSMLAKSREFLAAPGFVYLELPDGETAVGFGTSREEFFIDHHYAFSAASLTLLAQKAGFRTVELERLHEPSDKYTLRAFLCPAE